MRIEENQKMDERIRDLERIGANARMQRLILDEDKPLPDAIVQNMWEVTRSHIKTHTFGPDNDIIMPPYLPNPARRMAYRHDLPTLLATDTVVSTI